MPTAKLNSFLVDHCFMIKGCDNGTFAASACPVVQLVAGS